MGIQSEHYGPLLIPVILDRLPDEIKLEISRKLGKENWRIDDFTKVLKEEITARECCLLMKCQGGNEASENDAKHFTTEALLTKTKILTCGFCKKNHFHDQCTTVTDVNERKEIVRKNRSCFRCLEKELP